VGYELGVAVGQLRRLKDLALRLFDDGRGYHAVAQGLAARVEECPLPLLWRVSALSEVHSNADLLASLLLPSVRVFSCAFSVGGATVPVLTSTVCALHQAGYKYTWEVRLRDEWTEALQSVATCSGILFKRSRAQSYACPPWTISQWTRP
jgi:hypothetical protein